MNLLSDSGALITTNGAYTPCGNGQHQALAADLITLYSAEELRGAIIIYPDGRWVQDCGPVPLTAEQREQIGFLAEFPPCGLREAALDILQLAQ